MKNLIKLSTVALMLLVGYTTNAQFNHDFSSSTSIQEYSGDWYGDSQGCFLKWSNGIHDYYYDNVADGVRSNSSSVVIRTPVLNFQGAFDITIEYTSTSSFNVWTNFGIPSSWTNGTTITGFPAGTKVTQTVRTGTLNGNYRPLIQCQTSGIVVHSVKITNVNYNPGPGCTVLNTPTCADADSDGVCDDVDDYPNDPNKAFSSVVPTTTYMYEDLFPSYGDFDFNDLVVSADREVITDADNTLRYLVVEAQVKAVGGSIAQGWALELNGINPSDVVSVNGNDVSGNVMTLGANGTENGQTYAVIPVFDNVNKVITGAGSSFFNTIAGDPVGTGDVLTVTIEFAKSSNLTLADLDYNFFSFRTADRTHEIHEIGMAPTSLANQALFGTMADATNLNTGETYVSVDGFPWAISSSGSDYAVEKTDMVEAFLKFAGWAQSGGTMYQDWHTNTAEGTYRNSAKIY